MAGGALVRVSHRRKHILEHVAHIILFFFFFFIHSYISVAVRLRRIILDKQKKEPKHRSHGYHSVFQQNIQTCITYHTGASRDIPHKAPCTDMTHGTGNLQLRLHGNMVNKEDVSLHCSAP